MAAHEHAHHHVTPMKVLLNTFIALIIATILTVVFHNMHLGMFAAPVAIVIATAKAMWVIMYFMGLKYDNVVNRIIFSTGFIFVAILLIFAALDIYTRVSAQSALVP